MEIERRTPSTRSVVWGLFLILAGIAFFLDRLHVVNLPSLSSLWPVVLFVIAAGRFIDGRVGGGVSMTLFGTWVLACTLHWNGMTFGNSWPLALIASGIGIVIRAFTGEEWLRRPRKEE